ncbi:MAG: tetratricopeptide repeat protein [Candidatus Gastranaerophilales bacterium]|nr:tetratricopeptide repeat protein [Candidatus Gastranaerophilales bacterium]
MKKKVIYFLAVLILVSQSAGCTFAKSKNTIYPPLKIAIKKYKAGNYTGCMQDCQFIVKTNPSALAYYYLAISCVQSGKKDDAITAYGSALALSKNAQLTDYATTGKRCLETPEQCKPETTAGTPSDLDKIIYSSYNDGISDSVRKGIEKQQLDLIKQQINNGQDLDNYNFNKINKNPEENNVAQRKPTNDEIIAALKLLGEAGLNPYGQMPGFNTVPQNDNNLISLPAQSQNGLSNYSPQAMQAVIMSSMMSNLNFNLNADKDK